ncbi:hypothetical protein C0J52_27290, partial [Blattella germanica]
SQRNILSGSYELRPHKILCTESLYIKVINITIRKYSIFGLPRLVFFKYFSVYFHFLYSTEQPVLGRSGKLPVYLCDEHHNILAIVGQNVAPQELKVYRKKMKIIGILLNLRFSSVCLRVLPIALLVRRDLMPRSLRRLLAVSGEPGKLDAIFNSKALRKGWFSASVTKMASSSLLEMRGRPGIARFETSLFS